ncbi:hypothetical protein [Actinomyces oricola]|uniref:hypothetical protein n=1 Tax=Actinomyces oricola TaxID=206043 RepID=UPI001F4F92FE|nr:hypothetical protein [Actinomyces oricola]
MSPHVHRAPSADDACPPPAVRPIRFLRRGAGVVLLVAALAASTGCGLRLGEGSAASLPTASQAEATRDSLARRTTLILSTAQVVAQSPDAGAVATAQTVAADAQVQLDALGGVWQPWATTVPTTYPTASPVETADPGATTETLVTELTEGVAQARQAALGAQDTAAAQLYASLFVSWSVSLYTLNSGAVTPAPREATAVSEPLPGEVLVAYDAARYAMEEVAARSEGSQRDHAVTDAGYAGGLVNASVAAGSQDVCPAAYAPPTEAADAATSLDVTWAREAWSEVMAAEVIGVGSASGAAREAGLDAALDAALRAQAWGAAIPALP